MTRKEYIKMDYEQIPNRTTRLILKLITNLQKNTLNKTQEEQRSNYEKEIN